MYKEKQGFGDSAVVTLNTNAISAEDMGVHGHYHVVCRDKNGNIKWEEKTPNLVVAAGKELMLDTLLKGASYSVNGPYLGLTNSTLTPAATDTMSTLIGGGHEFTNYTVGGSAIRGTATFASAISTGTTPTNVTNSTAGSITYTITGAGGTIYGCFLVTGPGASNSQGNTGGTLYSEGNFATSKNTTAGDTVSVTYSTTATS